ncbi:MAG: CBS domain-containing protein [Cyanobacteria bacterium J06635_10]
MSSINELFDLLALHQVIDSYCLRVSPDTSIGDAIALMLNISYTNEEKANCVLVTEECRLVGIFTQVDALRLAISGKNLSSMTVGEVMIREVISLKHETHQDIFTALRVMRQHQISHLPIVDEKDNLLGIVEEKSLLQFFLDQDDSIIPLQKQIELERQSWQ